MQVVTRIEARRQARRIGRVTHGRIEVDHGAEGAAR
jgi:hypothetical protein